MTDKPLKAIHGSPDKLFQIGEFQIDFECYVLEGGIRVLSGRGVQKALGLGKAHGAKLKQFLGSKQIKPFISSELAMAISKPIRFIRPGRGGVVALGYEATILQKICDLVLTARKAGALQTIEQKAVAEKCEMLVRVFAKVGIIALIDEITGYKYAQDRDAIYQILKAYVREELLPWTKTFPDEFYRQMFRLHNWSYNPQKTKRPSVVGIWTNRLIYDKLPDGVLEELQQKNPKVYRTTRRYKHFQFLTEDIGDPHLRGHLQQVLILMRISPNWRVFLRHFNRAFPMVGDQLSLEGENFEIIELDK
jgi:hypothetical protein